jgi:hypothetical protein
VSLRALQHVLDPDQQFAHADTRGVIPYRTDDQQPAVPGLASVSPRKLG